MVSSLEKWSRMIGYGGQVYQGGQDTTVAKQTARARGTNLPTITTIELY